VFVCALHSLLRTFKWMRLTVTIKTVRMVKQIASAMPTFIQTLMPSCGSIPIHTEHVRTEEVDVSQVIGAITEYE